MQFSQQYFHMLVRETFLLLLLRALLAQNCLSGCLECDETGDYCSACHEGYQSALTGACILQKVAACSLYADAQTCVRCEPTYKLIRGTCVRDYSGCIWNPSGEECLECSPELRLSMGACVGVLNCRAYSRERCASCAEGFALVGSVCMAQPTNCLAANPANGVCVQCRATHALSGYQCVPKLLFSSNCQLQDHTGHCQRCKQGYNNIDGSCFTNAEARAFPTLSPTAQNDTDLAETTLEQPEKPTKEKSSEEGVAQGGIEDSNSSISNDQSTGNNDGKSSLELILSKLSIYCKVFSSSGVCGQCYSGFYMLKGYCLPIDPYCRSFDAKANVCMDCYKGYTLNASKKCAVAKLPPSDPNCRVYQGEDCLDCYPTFHLKLGTCVANNPLCRKATLEGECESCFEGYLLAEGDCVVDSSQNPNIFDPYCIRINGSDCTLCVNGYFLDQNAICSPLPLNCLTHDRDGSCLQCFAGYTLAAARCQPLVENCQEYEAEGCVRCRKGFFVKRGQCFQLDVTCAVYDEDGACQQCVATYFMVNGECVYPSLGFDPLCAAYSNSFCSACKTGSFLANYRCVAIDPNCLSFDESRMRCLSCANGMRLHGIGCLL